MPAVFYIALDVIAENWPDGIRQELAQLKIPDAKVGLPPVDICEGLKRRRIQYPWRTIGYLYNGQGSCTATLVYKNVVVTAAHCVIDPATKKLVTTAISFSTPRRLRRAACRWTFSCRCCPARASCKLTK